MFTKIYDFLKRFIKECYKDFLIVGFIAAILLVGFPYVIYRPGGTINLNKRINIKEEYSYKGKLNMTYVTVAKANIPNIILSKIINNWDLESKDTLTYENDSIKDTLKKDKYALKESQDNAVLAAYKLTGNSIKITKYHNYIYYIAKEAKTTLKDFDEIISINDEEVSSLEDMKKIVSSYQKGDVLDIKVRRNKKEMIATAKVFNTSDGPKIGVGIYTNIEYIADPKIDIKSKNSESGPSGGLMTALAIYNKLTNEDITKGKNISGTGTIDSNGNIGVIGGVKYKLIGAVKDKSDIFICPKDNYKETLKIAKKNHYKIKIITGDTLEEIINKLKKI